MTSGGETPGIGGIPDLKPPKTRAPQAWSGMVKALHRDLTDELRRAQRARRAMLKAGRRGR